MFVLAYSGVEKCKKLCSRANVHMAHGTFKGKFGFSVFENCCQQAGAELCQAQLKLKVKVKALSLIFENGNVEEV